MHGLCFDFFYPVLRKHAAAKKMFFFFLLRGSVSLTGFNSTGLIEFCETFSRIGVRTLKNDFKGAFTIILSKETQVCSLEWVEHGFVVMEAMFVPRLHRVLY